MIEFLFVFERVLNQICTQLFGIFILMLEFGFKYLAYSF